MPLRKLILELYGKGLHIIMTNGERIITIFRDAGLTLEEFQQLL